MAKWQKMSISLNRGAEEGMYAVLTRRGIDTFVVEDSLLWEQGKKLGWGDYFPETTSSPQITVTCYFAKPWAEQEILALEKELAELVRYGFEPGPVRISTALVEDQNWLEAWKDHYQPQRIGRIVIQPSWQAAQILEKPGDLVIRLDPGLAFGSGDHPTTAMCLRFLQELELENKLVWDVGTGSGILAVAAAKFGAEVQAVDIDPVAVDVARKNSVLNGVKFPVLLGSLERLRGTPDLVIANIIADVIIDMLEAVWAHLAPGGLLAAAGIISRREQEVLAAARETGFEVVQKISDDAWVGCLWRKGL